MNRGLYIILRKIADQPNEAQLVDRYLSLVKDLNEIEQTDAILDLAHLLVKFDPNRAMQLSRQVSEKHPESARKRAAKIIQSALLSLRTKLEESDSNQKLVKKESTIVSERLSNEAEKDVELIQSDEPLVEMISQSDESTQTKGKINRNELSEQVLIEENISSKKIAVDANQVTQIMVDQDPAESGNDSSLSFKLENTGSLQQIAISHEEEPKTPTDLELRNVPRKQSLEIQSEDISDIKTLEFAVDIQSKISALQSAFSEEIIQKDDQESVKTVVMQDQQPQIQKQEKQVTYLVIPTNFKQLLTEKVEQAKQQDWSPQVLEGFIAEVWGPFVDLQVAELVRATNCERATPQLWSYYLKGLLLKNRARLALAEIREFIHVEHSLGWCQIAHRYLEEITQKLELNMFHWENEEGVEAFVKKINKRLNPKLSAIAI